MRQYMYIAMLALSSIASSETLTIGITGDNPPFSSTIDTHHHYYGFDIQLMDAICIRMNVTCKYKAMLFKYFAPSIDEQTIDVAIDSIIITENRKNKYLFSNAYLPSYVQFLTTENSSIQSANDIKNADIGIGVRQKDQFEDLLNNLNLKHIKISVFSHMPNLLENLAQKKVSVIVINSISAQYWYGNNANQYKLIGKPMPLGEGFGIMGKKGSNALVERINNALTKMKADGSYAKIYSQYF